MTEISRRRVLGALVATAVGVPLTACGADRPGLAHGFSTGQGVAADSGLIALRNVLVVSAAPGRGTVLATIFNGGSAGDALLKMAVAGGDAILVPATIPIPAVGDAVLGMDTSLAEQPSTAVLQGSAVKPGYFVHLTFVFERAAPVEVGAIVVARAGPYAEVPVRPIGPVE